MIYSLGIIVASDKGARGDRLDESGMLISEILEKHCFKTKAYVIVADDRYLLADEMMRMSDELELNLVLTTGGTGFSSRDVTPEATQDVCERMCPGIAEAMRAYSMKVTPKAMLSRSVAGIRGKTLIINLPGSPKAVRENLECILPSIPHGLDILLGRDSECATKE